MLELVEAIALLADRVSACGPRQMLQAVAEWAERQGIPAQVSMEERMACGIGACLGCAVKIQKPGEKDWQYLRVCRDGPVITSSGTFGSGREYGELIDLNCLGAVTVKGVSCEPWKGNPAPRIAETQSGMLNSIGLQNPGVEHFIEHDLPFLRQHDTKIIVNICGHTLAQYCAVAERLADCDVDMLELNISCPSVEEGGLAFGTAPPHVVERVVRAVRHYAGQPQSRWGRRTSITLMPRWRS